jgi:hypothetical protein
VSSLARACFVFTLRDRRPIHPPLGFCPLPRAGPAVEASAAHMAVPRLSPARASRVASATRANPAAERRSAGGCDVATARARHSLKLCAPNSTVSAIPVLFPLGSVCTWLSRAHGTYVAFSSFLSTFLSCARGGWARRRTS